MHTQSIRKKAGQGGTESIALIGFGNWGTALAAGLCKAGIPVHEIVVRRLQDSDRRRARKLCAQLVTLAGEGRYAAKLDADILWICTPDAAIATTAAALARRGLGRSRPIVLHSSGALASTELAAVREAGASVASVHPLMSFPRRVAASLEHVPFAVEGDARAVRAATRIVRKIGGEAFSIRTEDKTIYHAFGAFASPLVTALLTASLAAGRAAGLSQTDAMRRMQPIVERTVANFFVQGAAKSLSGPVARGDVATVARHLAALEAQPELAELREIYRALQTFAVTALPGKQKAALRKVLCDGRHLSHISPQKHE